MWANIATVIVALLGAACIGFIMTRGKGEPVSENTALRKEIKALESQVDALSKLLSETQARVATLELELEKERQDRQYAEWQLTYLQALQGDHPNTLPKPRPK